MRSRVGYPIEITFIGETALITGFALETFKAGGN